MTYWARKGRAEKDKGKAGRGFLPLGRIIVLAGPALVAAFVAALLVPWGLYLEISLYSNGSIVFSRRVSPGDQFTIQFIHSVMKTPVSEIFRIDGPENFDLVESIYYSFGAGLPSEELEGQEIVLEDGHLRITGFRRSFRRLLLAIGRVARHHIVIGKESIPLASLAAPGTSIVIQVRRRSPVAVLLGLAGRAGP
ncbi:MAG TPA: DUF1850 domain-containing protein [Firmicutes bacterium]|nr:DUF1850 domain-containing protein [Bacillota bacterium]